MRTAEIQYIVPDSTANQAEYEAILAAIGKYQDEIPPGVDNTAEIAQLDENTVSVKLSRQALRHKTDVRGQNLVAEMRRGVELHFAEADRERLAQRFSKPLI